MSTGLQGDLGLPGVPETLLPPDPAAAALAALPGSPTAGGTASRDALSRVAASYPASSLAWAELAESALAADEPVEAYAYARVGYHRGLDALRKSGWRGQGPIPWSHEPNRGFLRALAALGRAARAIGESDEETRCATFLRSSSQEAAAALGV